jgi:prohibitin 1
MGTKYFTAIFLGLILFSGCAVIRPGEAGVKQKLGKLDNKVITQGAVVYNPFITRVIKTSIQTNNLELTISLPSKEGLSINSQISILYKLEKNKVVNIISTYGLDYEPIIANVFRSASADVCAQYPAKDMHSGMRSEIENMILDKMSTTLKPQGILVEAVLMKSIQLPAGLAKSIEQKLQAEQDAMRMEFILQQSRADAERRIIEATGIKDAQKIMSEGLTDQIIKIRSIEAFSELSKSANTKIIITDGKTPMLIGNQDLQ